jgi:O-antigen/teichoic acid export membrane protein
MLILVLIILILGDQAITLIFGREFMASKIDLLMFTLFALFYFLSTLLTNVLMIWQRLWPLTVSWGIGIVLTILFSFFGPFPIPLRIEVGLVIGALVTLIILTRQYYQALKRAESTRKKED